MLEKARCTKWKAPHAGLSSFWSKLTLAHIHQAQAAINLIAIVSTEASNFIRPIIPCEIKVIAKLAHATVATHAQAKHARGRSSSSIHPPQAVSGLGEAIEYGLRHLLREALRQLLLHAVHRSRGVLNDFGDQGIHREPAG